MLGSLLNHGARELVKKVVNLHLFRGKDDMVAKASHKGNHGVNVGNRKPARHTVNQYVLIQIGLSFHFCFKHYLNLGLWDAAA